MAKTIQQLKKEYEEAKKKGNKAAMAKAHAEADKIRGFQTETTVSGGKYYQTPSRMNGQLSEKAVKNIPKALPKATTKSTLYSPSVRRIGQSVSQSQKDKIANKTYSDFSDTPTKALAGAIEGFLPVNTAQNYHPAIKSNLQDFTGSKAYTGGKIGGTVASFAIPYAGATKTVKAIPTVAKAGTALGNTIGKLAPKLGTQTAQKIGQGVAGSVATDLAVGLPLNVNYALNKEGLKGTDALKNIAVNTGIDLATGGVIESLPAVAKGIKSLSKERIPIVQPNGKIKMQSVPTPDAGANFTASVKKTTPDLHSKALSKDNTPDFDSQTPNVPGEAQDAPLKMTLDEYLGAKGLSAPVSNFMLDKLRIPHGQTIRQETKMIKEANAVADAYQKERSSAIKEYRNKLESGEIVGKTNLERRIESANGHPDLESTQAARRRLEKQGIDWKNYNAENNPTASVKKSTSDLYNKSFLPNENYSYRFTKTDSPISDYGHAMFGDNAERVSMFGNNVFNVKKSNLKNVDDILPDIKLQWQKDLKSGMLKDYNLSSYQVNDIDDIINSFNPTSIADAAEAYDDGDAVKWLFDRVLEPKKIYGIKTNDGAVVFDKKLINKDMAATKYYNSIKPKELAKKAAEKNKKENPEYAKFMSEMKTKYGKDGMWSKMTDSEFNRFEYLDARKYDQPKPILKSSNLTLQPRKAEKGTSVPEKQTFVKNGDFSNAKAESYKKALMQLALDEYDKTVVSIADYIANYKPKGVDVGIIPKNGDELMRDGGIRYATSKNDLWYQDYYKKYGRKPSKAESKELAEKIVKESLMTKSGEFYNPDLGKVVEELHGLQKDLGADIYKGDKTIDDLVKQYGALPKGEIPARDIQVPKKTDYGETQRYARTLQESTIVDDNLFKDINEAIAQGSFTKPTKSNRTAVEDASRTIEAEGLDESVAKFKSVITSDKKPTSYDIALGNRVLQELQKSGRYEDALDAAVDLSEILSESGRTLQAAKIAKRLSPEGRLMIASRTAKKISQKTGTEVKISDETAELISNAKTEKEVVDANQKAAIEMWNQVPATLTDKINSWRYMAMLFNPKTHIRNIVGNSIFLPVREIKNLVGTGLERVLIPNGERTKAVLNPVKDKSLIKFASDDFKNVKSLLKNEGKLDDNVRNLDAKVFNSKILEGIRKLNLNALNAEDTWFMKFAYDSSLAQYMKANKLTPEKMVGEALEKARSYAMNEALKATYRDFNSLANLISRGKHTLASGKYGVLGKAGGVALEGTMPFTKTPMNIVKRGVAYSPANLARGIASLNRVKSGKVTATEAIDQLASGLTGTALLALGTYLGYNEIVKGKEGEYKDKLYNYNRMLGSQNYSLNIDGKSYTLDWAAPLSMPFFVGVELSNAIKDGRFGTNSLATVLDSMTKITDPMVNMSMLKGINDIVTNNFEGIGQTVLDIGTGYLGQFNPTLLGQVARTADDTRRSTISTSETGLGRTIEKFTRKQVAKLPMASSKLEPYVDLWGREQKNGNAVENFLSPGYFESENITPVDKELKTLIDRLDEDSIKEILPSSTAYKYTIESDSIPYRMTEKESTAYQKTRGQESYTGLEKLFKSSEYKVMTDEEKIKAIKDVYSDAGQKAKYNYFDNKGLPVTLALDKNYQEKYQSVKNIVSDKEFYNAVNAVQSAGSKDIQKAYAINETVRNPDARLFEVFGISADSKEGYISTIQKARQLKESGISADEYIKAYDASNTNGSSGVSKAEGMAYLNTRSDLTRKQKAVLLQALVPGLKTRNNPYN